MFRGKQKRNSNSDVSKLLKRLYVKVPGSKSKSFPNLDITDHIARKIFKYSFTKKVKSIELKPKVFAYYAPYIRKDFRKLTFSFTSHFDRKKFSNNEKKLITKTLGSLKHLKRLAITDTDPFDFIRASRKIHCLENLSFKIKETDVPHIYNLFRGSSKLHVVNLRIFRDEHTPIANKPHLFDLTWRFLKDLINLKNLRTLKLNIDDCFFTEDPNFFNRLLEMLDCSKIETLNLILFLSNYEEDKLSEGAKRMLSRFKILMFIAIHPEFIMQILVNFNTSKKRFD